MHRDETWDGSFELADVATDVVEPRSGLAAEPATEVIVAEAVEAEVVEAEPVEAELLADDLVEAEAVEAAEVDEVEEAAERVCEAARHFLAAAPTAESLRAGSGSRERSIERARAHLDQVLTAEMSRRLEDVQWYLTGVQVGLDSLDRLHDVSSLVYREEDRGSVGARKVANLRVVHEQLVEFEKSFDPSADSVRRARLLLEHRIRFEALLEDLEERAAVRVPANDTDSVTLSLFAQVARDIRRIVNQMRAYENLVGALRRLEQVPRWPPGARRKKVREFVTSYGSILSLIELEGEEHFADLAMVKQRQVEVRGHIAEIRAHLRRVHRALFDAKGAEAGDTERPERDLEPEDVIPVLKKVAEHGAEFLKRTHGVYEHTVERSELVAELQRYLASIDPTGH